MPYASNRMQLLRDMELAKFIAADDGDDKAAEENLEI